MKKRKIKNYFKFGILLIGILFTLTNCDKDHLSETSNAEDLSATQSLYRVEKLTIQQIPDIVNFLNSKAKKNLFLKESNNKSIIGGAIFDNENVLKVMDTLNHSNYSFNFVFPTTPKNVFYNLIVGVTPSGVKQEPYILKYVVKESHLEGFIQSGFNLSAFSGTIGLHPFNDFFNNADFNGRDCNQYDQYGDPIPCQQIIVSSSSTSGGSGTTTIGDAVAGGASSGVYIGESGGGGRSVCSWSVTTSSPCKDGWTHLHPSMGGCGGVYLILDISCNLSSNRTSSKANTDCPPCIIVSDGGVGINITKCLPGFKEVNGICVPISLPCISIKNQLNNIYYKEKVEELKGKTHLKYETGYAEDKEGNITPLPLLDGGHSLDLKVGTNTKGYIHSHQNDFLTGKIVDGKNEIAQPIRIFSPADIIKLLSIAKNTLRSNIPLDEVYGTMISSTGNYTLKFTGNIDHIHGFLNADDLRDVYIEYIKEFGLEEGFLKFIKNEIKIDGISLYKIEDNGQIIQKTIENNGIIVLVNCN
ncbi:MAG: hypothetical protein Q7U08_05855 [Flavobacteriaceae bacterium]|nr:hypothetical protein [Flavobacteriaceae bacterium]